MGLAEAKEIVRIGVSKGISQRRACDVMGFNRSSIRYKPTGLTKLTLRTEVKAIELAKKHQANGYKSITTMLRRLGRDRQRLPRREAQLYQPQHHEPKHWLPPREGSALGESSLWR
jgi:hypothetical protein